MDLRVSLCPLFDLVNKKQTVEISKRSIIIFSLTLSLPIFWKICCLSATFISVVRGIMPYEASTFFKILILQFFYLIKNCNTPILTYQNLKHMKHNRCSVYEGLLIG